MILIQLIQEIGSKKRKMQLIVGIDRIYALNMNDCALAYGINKCKKVNYLPRSKYYRH